MAGDDLTIFLFFLSLAFGFGFEAVRAETVPRRTIFAVLGVACFFAAIFWLQIKTIWPAFTVAITSIATNPLAWFIVGMFILAVFAFHRQKNRSAVDRPVATPIPAPIAIPASAPEPPKSKKAFIDVSPSYLLGLYKNRTAVQGNALAAAYIGKWIVVTGKVIDISQDRPGNDFLVQFSDSEGAWLAATFSEELSEKISHIPHGATITIRGAIRSVDTLRVILKECELGEPGQN
jgi:hypothetical protein